MIFTAIATMKARIHSFEFGRLAQLWCLAVVVLAYSVLEMAIANSLFLTKVGAGHLPQVFILIGLGSLPSYLIFSQIADRYSRTKLFQFALIVAVVIALGLRGLINIDTAWVYYLLLVVLFFQWDFHNTILYSSLLTDYFTATEYKKYAPAIGIGQAVGMFTGGVLTSVLPQFLSTEDLLYYVPILMGGAIVQLWWLETSQVKLVVSSQDGNEADVLEAIKTFPKLVQKYPLMFFLAGSSFLLVIIYLTTEFLWFSVYEQYFTSDELTQFLGLMRIGVSILQILVLYCLTRPLLQWIGVSRMNVVYPLTTLVSLISFLFNINLWTGIGLHINGDGLFKSINTPVHQLNYNAIPQEFIGRIRTISDGVFYSTGLTLVGFLLLFAHARLNLTQIAWIAVCLGVVFLLLRIPMGRFYGAGLEDMIQANTIDFSQLQDSGGLPMEKTVSFIREWFRDASIERHYRALDLATELDCAVAVLGDILRLPTHNDDRLRHKVLFLLHQSSDPQLVLLLKQLLKSELMVHRAIALEALIAKQVKFSIDELTPLLKSDVSEIKILASIAILLQEPKDSTLSLTAMGYLQGSFSDAAGFALLRATPYHSNPQQVDLILNRLNHSTQFAIAGLKTLTQLGQTDPEAWQIAVPFLNHSEPQLRAAAYAYLSQKHPQQALDYSVSGFNDADASVRETVATLVAQHKQQGLTLAQSKLLSSDQRVQGTAIAALGKMKTKQAQDSLFEYLTPDFQQLKTISLWQQQIPLDEVWQPLRIAIHDFQVRLIHKVFNILSCLGYESTVNAVKFALLNSDGRDRANAVEVLSSFKERRFIRPLLPRLEVNLAPQSPNQADFDEQWAASAGLQILQKAIQSSDRWIQQAAFESLANFPKAFLNKLDPLLQTQFSKQSLTRVAHRGSMTQILLLKKVPIFQNLTLDELELIGRELHGERVLAKSVIYTEGSWGQYFYLIASGAVELTKRIGDQPVEFKRIGIGDHFGEVCLFDDAPHWDGAIAVEDCELLKLEKEKFKALMMQRPRISLELCRYLSQRLREYDNFCGIQGQNTDA